MEEYVSVYSDCKVDIIIPVFNDSDNLKRCIGSLEAQVSGLPGIGVIVIDNGSIPPIESVKCGKIPVRVLRCETPGSYAARNLGASVSEADVLAFVDADCVLADGWLVSGLKTLLDTGSDVVVGGDVLFFDPIKPTPTEAYQIMVGFGQEENIRVGKFSVTANLFVRMSTFQNVGRFNEELLSGGDREWCLRAGSLGIPVIFEGRAVVYTKPRRRLTQAITQARRVAGGRYVLAKSEAKENLVPFEAPQKKSFITKLKTILLNRDFGFAMRLKVFYVASVLFLVRKLEIIRLGLGGKMERR